MWWHVEAIGVFRIFCFWLEMLYFNQVILRFKPRRARNMWCSPLGSCDIYPLDPDSSLKPVNQQTHARTWPAEGLRHVRGPREPERYRLCLSPPVKKNHIHYEPRVFFSLEVYFFAYHLAPSSAGWPSSADGINSRVTCSSDHERSSSWKSAVETMEERVCTANKNASVTCISSINSNLERTRACGALDRLKSGTSHRPSNADVGLLSNKNVAGRLFILGERTPLGARS